MKAFPDPAMAYCRGMRTLTFILVMLASSAAFAQDGPAYGPMLEGYDYPFPVSQYRFTSQGVGLEMAYMDVAPARPNGHTIMLLHGKNFCAATWKDTIIAL